MIWNCLPYHEKALLIRNEYIFAFNQLETMSQDFEEEVCGGVVVSGQPGFGMYVVCHRP